MNYCSSADFLHPVCNFLVALFVADNGIIHITVEVGAEPWLDPTDLVSALPLTLEKPFSLWRLMALSLEGANL